MDYLEADLQINNSNYNSDPITLPTGGVTFDFTNVTGGSQGQNRWKQFGSGTYYSSTAGSVEITAPANYVITSIGITYYGGYNAQTVSYSPAGTTSSKTSWTGRSNSVTVTMNGSRNNSNRVSRIRVIGEIVH